MLYRRFIFLLVLERNPLVLHRLPLDNVQDSTCPGLRLHKVRNPSDRERHVHNKDQQSSLHRNEVQGHTLDQNTQSIVHALVKKNNDNKKNAYF